MSAARIHLFDTTLRDGAQTTGVDFSLDDKRAVAGLLDRLGIDYRGRLSRSEPDGYDVLLQEAHAKSRLRSLRHDEARRHFRLQ